MNKYLVEFLGTMFLMYVILATGNWAAIGCALAVGVLLGGPISGGSYNPAVTIALYSAGKLEKPDVVPYIIVEILGALAAFYAYQNYVNKPQNNSQK
jgi:aquaporin Z